MVRLIVLRERPLDLLYLEELPLVLMVFFLSPSSTSFRPVTEMEHVSRGCTWHEQ